MKKWFKGLFWTKWKVCSTIWPYDEGYGAYRKNILTGSLTIIDSGVTHGTAMRTVNELNSKKCKKN